MGVKAVAIVRKIRDQLYEETKNLSLEEQKLLVEKESRELQEELKKTGLLKKNSPRSRKERSRKHRSETLEGNSAKHDEQRSSR
jgi:hypothetical protein